MDKAVHKRQIILMDLVGQHIHLLNGIGLSFQQLDLFP